MEITKRICAVLALFVSLFCLTGCQANEVTQLTCDQIIAAYEKAGYEIFHKDTAAEEYAWACYVKAEDKESGEYIFFHFFDSEDAAKAYADTQQWNVVLWLYSLISSQPTWITVKTYGNIEYEYGNSALIGPFQELLGEIRGQRESGPDA